LKGTLVKTFFLRAVGVRDGSKRGVGVINVNPDSGCKERRNMRGFMLLL